MIRFKGQGFYSRFGPRYVASRDPEAVQLGAVERPIVNESTLLWGVMEFGRVIEVGGTLVQRSDGSHRAASIARLPADGLGPDSASRA